MSRSWAGGMCGTRDVGHEVRVLASLAAERRLPEWAGGRIPTAVGGKTERPVDDIATTLSPSRIPMVQAKNGMRQGGLPGDTRPLPDAARYDQLLLSRQRAVR